MSLSHDFEVSYPFEKIIPLLKDPNYPKDHWLNKHAAKDMALTAHDASVVWVVLQSLLASEPNSEGWRAIGFTVTKTREHLITPILRPVNLVRSDQAEVNEAIYHLPPASDDERQAS